MIISGVEISSAPGMRTQLGRSRADDYNLWMWGSGTLGQLGDESTVSKSSPVQTISSGTNWALVSAGTSYSSAVKTDGTLWTWGRNQNGQLGTNDILHRSSPVQTIAGGNNWRTVLAGISRVAAIKTDGTLWMWGDNSAGQLGDNTTGVAGIKSSPVQTIAGGTNWSTVAVGSEATAAIKTDGTLWTWGNNTNGSLGDNTIIAKSSPIQTIAGGSNWSSVSSRATFVAAIKADGTLWTWGNNYVGQLGISSIAHRSSPVQTVSGGTNWSLISAGSRGATAIKTDGTLWAWGWNTQGALGTNDTTHRSQPVQTIAGGTNWSTVSSGYNHTASIKTDGRLWMWGGSSLLGDASLSFQSSPVQTIVSGTNWKQVYAGDSFTAAIIATTFAE